MVKPRNMQKTVKKLEKKLDLIRAWLIEKSISVPEFPHEIIEIAYQTLGRERKKKNASVSSLHAYASNVIQWVEIEKNGGVTAKMRRESGTPQEKIEAFYRCYAWRKIRFTVLQKFGAKCLCCNATRESGKIMHVDHVKPLRFNWELRLDPENLQILCDECNHGKGNWSEADFRPAQQN